MANEGAVGVLDQAGKKVRVIELVTYIAGVPTTVEMQVLSISDSAGNTIDNFASYNLQMQQLTELRLLREAIETWLGRPSFGVPSALSTIPQFPPAATN